MNQKFAYMIADATNGNFILHAGIPVDILAESGDVWCNEILKDGICVVGVKVNDKYMKFYVPNKSVIVSSERISLEA